MNSNGRQSSLDAYGRWYGAQHFAIAFTSTIEGEEAKRVTTRGWDKTQPLPDGEFGAALLANRGVNRNPAVVLRPSNLIVVECDSEEDLTLIQDLGLPETITVRSSAPYKRHFYFRPDPKQETLPAVAFRFESGKLTADSGRYFLCPPAIHPSGALYTFLPGHGPDEMKIATFPTVAYAELVERANVEDRGLRDRIEHDPQAKIRAGNRRDFVFRYACMLRRWGLSRSEIEEACYALNEARCEPPVERRLISIQVDGAMRQHGEQEIAKELSRPILGDDWEDEPIIPFPELDEDSHSWVPLNLSQLGIISPDPPSINGIVYPAKKHLFSGEPEAMKTWAAMILVVEQIKAGAHCVYIDFEMGPIDTRRRFHALGLTDDDLEQGLSYIEPQEAIIHRLGYVNDLLADKTPSLIIVDAMTGALSIHGCDPNSGKEVEGFFRAVIDPLRSTGGAIVILDHLAKDKDNRGKFAIGSERKVGASDIHLGFETLRPFGRGRDGVAKITTLKDRPGWLPRPRTGTVKFNSDSNYDITYTLELETEGGHTTTQPNRFRPTIYMERVSIYLELQKQPVSKNKVEENVPGKAEYVRKAIDVLVDENYVIETEGLRKSLLLVSVNAYRKSEDDEHIEDDQDDTN